MDISRKRHAGAADITDDKQTGKTSRHRGVSWNKKKKRWEAQITINWKNRHIGYFADEDAAAAAYTTACQEIGRLPRLLNPKEKQKNKFWHDLIQNTLSSTKTRNARGRQHEHNINKKFIKDLWAKQGKQCELSGISAVEKPMSHWQVSIDRIDNNLGYVRGNVRLVCLEFNGVAQWTPAKIQLARMGPSLEETRIDVEAICASMRQKGNKNWGGRRRRRSTQQCPNTGATLHECRPCNQFLPVSEFHKNQNRCKSCQRKLNNAFRRTPRGKMLQLIDNAKSNSKKRKGKKTYREDDDCTLTFDEAGRNLQSAEGVVCVQRAAAAFSWRLVDQPRTPEPEIELQPSQLRPCVPRVQYRGLFGRTRRYREPWLERRKDTIFSLTK